MLVLLVGPKGSGKSHVGRLLERHLGVSFFHVEPHWMEYHADCERAGRAPRLADGIARIHPRIREALRTHTHVCVETTGASPEILADLLSLADRTKTLIARVAAPLELCLERIASRDQTSQIQMEVESIRQVHARADAIELEADLTLENLALTDAEILAAFRAAFATRGAPGLP